MSNDTWSGIIWHDHVDANMTSLEKGTCHENHVVWHLPPNACFHVTHGTWKMNNVKTHVM